MTSTIVDRRRPLAKVASVFSAIAVLVVVVDASSLAPRSALFSLPPSKRIAPHNPRGAVPTTIATPSSHHLPRDATPRLARSPDGGGDFIYRNDDDDEGGGDSSPSDASLLSELRTARRDMFGMDVPSNDDLRAAAKNAENDFLRAMRRQTEIFKRMKDDVGSDMACKSFMERIREADDDAAIVDESYDDDCGRSLVRRMMGREDGDDEVAFRGPLDGITSVDNVNSWQ
jgi:hypothetical protein